MKQEKPVEQQPATVATRTTTTAVTAPITDDEKVVERAKRGLQDPDDTNVTSNETATVTQEPQREEEGREGSATSSTTVNALFEHFETVEKRFEAVEKERTETQDRIASLKQTLSVLQEPSAQTEGVGGGGGISDTVAKAAILSALDVEVEDNSGLYVEPVQSSDATVAPDGGGAVVHVVGEILGGEGGGGTEPTADQSGCHMVGEILGGEGGGGTEPTADQSGPNISAGDQSGTDTVPHGVATTDNPLVPKPTKLDQTVPKSSSTGASPPSTSAATVPSTAVKTGRQKRQLAASFARSTS